MAMMTNNMTMMTSKMIMMKMMMFFASCFLLLLVPTSSFSTLPTTTSTLLSTTSPPPSSTSTSTSTSLFMGGYYSEPKDDDDDNGNKLSGIDKSKTHMLFGIRCVEDVIYCSHNTSIVNLRPIDETMIRETDTEPMAQQRLVQYLMTPDENQDVYAKPILKGKRIVQIGVGGTAMACAYYGNCESVVVVDNDERRLQIYEHAYEAFNNKKNKNKSGDDGDKSDDDEKEEKDDDDKEEPTAVTPCPLETMFLEPKDALPKADVIILSTEDEEWIGAALDSDRTRTCLFEGAY